LLIALCILLTLLTGGSTLLCIRSIGRNFELMGRLQEIDEALQSSIIILNAQHDIIDKKTKIELFSDDPIVRELVSDMATAKESVAAVAKLLDSVTEDEETPTEEEDNDADSKDSNS